MWRSIVRRARRTIQASGLDRRRATWKGASQSPVPVCRSHPVFCLSNPDPAANAAPTARAAGDVIRTFWSTRYDDFATESLALFIPVYFCLAAWTSGAAIPSGSFSPTILLGSAMGRLFAHLLRLFNIVRQPDAALYSLLGAAGFFTGAYV